MTEGEALSAIRGNDPALAAKAETEGGIVGRPAGDTAEALAADIEKAGLMEEENIGTK